MKQVKDEFEILSDIDSFTEKVIVDIGCGAGVMVRELTTRGARVIGIDKAAMIIKAKEVLRVGNETFLVGEGENLPLEDNYVDIVIFFASLHHIPEGKMNQALMEAQRILKSNGIVFCIEPVGLPGSYFEVLSLLEDERDVQDKAYKAIIRATKKGYIRDIKESMVYMERSYADYVKLVNFFVEDESKKKECLERGKEITVKLSKEQGIDFQDFRYRSICRINVLKKV